MGMRLFYSSLFLVSAALAQYDDDYYDLSDSSSSSTDRLESSTMGDSTTVAQKKELTFEDVVEIIRYPVDVLQNLDENPFIAEHKAYELLNRMKNFEWPQRPRTRKWLNSNVEDSCIEEDCNMEEMNEDFENFDSKKTYQGKIPTESYKKYKACFKAIADKDVSHESGRAVKTGYKTRNKIRKQCIPYEWNKLGLPMYNENH